MLEYAFFIPVTPYLAYGRKNKLELEDMPTHFISSCESNTRGKLQVLGAILARVGGCTVAR